MYSPIETICTAIVKITLHYLVTLIIDRVYGVFVFFNSVLESAKIKDFGLNCKSMPLEGAYLEERQYKNDSIQSKINNWRAFSLTL